MNLSRTTKIIILGILAVAFLFIVVNTVDAVATLENGFLSRGMYSDLKYSKFTGGGVTNAWYRNGASTDLFDDSPSINDSIYVYMCAPFTGWEVVSLTPMASTDHVLAFEYWNGLAWTAVSGLTDGTNNLTQVGQITFTKPTDWETVSPSTGAGSKSGAYAIFALRIRLVSFTDITEGGYLAGYQKVRQKYIHLNDGGSHTPASLYAEDVANGWGVITKKGDYAYDISCGVYFHTATFTFDKTKIKIGDAGSPNYVPFRVYGCTMICNDDATYMSDNLASALIVYSKGSFGTMTFYPNKASKFYNLYLAQPYDTHYSRFATYTSGGSGQAQWYNVLIGSMMYTGGSHNFVRMNFQNIQYLLSAGDTIYDNCIFGTRFSKDPGYAPVVLRPTFDGGSGATSDWIGMYYPDSATKQHHMDVVSGSWTKGNKWKCFCDDYLPASTKRSHIQIYSQFLNIDTFDKDGNPISGVSLKLKNETGFSVLWEDLDVYFTSSPSDTLDTSLTVDDASTLNVGDKILWWGEIMNITNLVGNTLTVERGLYDSARGFNLNDRYVPLRRQVESMTIDESKDEIYVLERVYYKYSLDGGVTSTGNLYKDYGTTTVTASKSGYETYTANFEIRDELDLSITMIPGLSDDCGLVEVYGTEYTSGEPGTIYAQLLYVNGTPANDKDITVNVWERMNKYIDNQTMTYITGSNGCYLYNFTTPNNISVFLVDVNCSDPVAYGSNEFHISQWSQDISDINNTVNSINDTITTTILDYLDDINNTINSNANLLTNMDTNITSILANWGAQTAQSLYNLEWETRNISAYVNNTIWGNFTELVGKWEGYTASSLYSVSNQAKDIADYINTTRWNSYFASNLYSASHQAGLTADYINNTRWDTKNAQDLYDISNNIKEIADYINNTRFGSYNLSDVMDAWSSHTGEELYNILYYINATRWNAQTAQDLYDKADDVSDMAQYINDTRWNTRTADDLYTLSNDINDIADYINTTKWGGQTAQTLYNKMNTIEGISNSINSTVVYINSSTWYLIKLTDFGTIYPNETYHAQLTIIDKYGIMVDADAVPLIKIYDPNGNLSTSTSMSHNSTGHYNYSFVTGPTNTTGQWMTSIITILDGNNIKNIGYWGLSSNAAEVTLSMLDTIITDIDALLKITNEGNTNQEYIYYYWITPNPSGGFYDVDTIDIGIASKMVKPGETFQKILTLNLPTTGAYYFKATVHYGSQYSNALVSFIATSTTPAPPSPPSGGGGTPSYSTLKLTILGDDATVYISQDNTLLDTQFIIDGETAFFHLYPGNYNIKAVGTKKTIKEFINIGSDTELTITFEEEAKGEFPSLLVVFGIGLVFFVFLVTRKVTKKKPMKKLKRKWVPYSKDKKTKAKQLSRKKEIEKKMRMGAIRRA